MRKLIKRAVKMLESIPSEIRRVEEEKASSEARAQAFLQTSRLTSESHRRIEAIRDSIQHKSQSDQ